MIHIDGSEKSGSGTIVKYAIVLSSLLGEEIHISNIRAKRDRPGLRPQHLASVAACARMCEAHVEGVSMSADELDAVTCALVGIMYLRGTYHAIGNPDEMLMILPR